MEKIINWVELSRLLAGNETSISKNRIPKKYQAKVNRLLKLLELWSNVV